MFDTQKLQTTIQSLNREGCFASKKTFLHHRKITVYDHSVHVAEISLKLADFPPVTVDEDSLIRGALLHDYFLYHDQKAVMIKFAVRRTCKHALLTCAHSITGMKV